MTERGIDQIGLAQIRGMKCPPQNRLPLFLDATTPRTCTTQYRKGSHRAPTLPREDGGTPVAPRKPIHSGGANPHAQGRAVPGNLVTHSTHAIRGSKYGIESPFSASFLRHPLTLESGLSINPLRKKSCQVNPAVAPGSCQTTASLGADGIARSAASKRPIAPPTASASSTNRP